MLPESAQAARDRRDTRQEGYRPTINASRSGGAVPSVDPFAGQPSLQQRTDPTMREPAPVPTPPSRQAAPAFESTVPQTAPDNLGGKLPLSTAQKNQLSLVDGTKRPAFSSYNLPSPQDPVMSGFSSLSGIAPDKAFPPRPRNPLSLFADR